MHDRTTKRSLIRDAFLSLRRLQKRFQVLHEHGKISGETAQCVRDALSCLRRSNDLYRNERAAPAPAPKVAVPPKKSTPAKKSRRCHGR